MTRLLPPSSNELNFRQIFYCSTLNPRQVRYADGGPKPDLLLPSLGPDAPAALMSTPLPVLPLEAGAAGEVPLLVCVTRAGTVQLAAQLTADIGQVRGLSVS